MTLGVMVPRHSKSSPQGPPGVPCSLPPVQGALMTRRLPQAPGWKTCQSRGLDPENPRAVNPRPDPVRTGELLCRTEERFSPAAQGSQLLQTGFSAPLAVRLGSQPSGTWAGERGSLGEDGAASSKGGR